MREPEFEWKQVPLALLGLSTLVVGIWIVLMFIGLMVLLSQAMVEALF
ncbi:hypothetical protein LCGC14_2586350 [marine sediment metagenome]|uniref:Uncharacterized protein n=1 Tax=marine sediment metagenome TaxID=412755 RepID=A0A0F9D5Q3_9ZZZZ